nr:hypothetical protein [Bacteroidota bacterium]
MAETPKFERLLIMLMTLSNGIKYSIDELMDFIREKSNVMKNNSTNAGIWQLGKIILHFLKRLKSNQDTIQI